MKETFELTGRVLRGSISENLHIKLDVDVKVEKVNLGAYVTLDCNELGYICKIADVSYAGEYSGYAAQVAKLKELDEKKIRIKPSKVYVESVPLYYDVSLKPLKVISKDGSVLEPQVLPPYFTKARFTTSEDIAPAFSHFQAPIIVGNFRGMKGDVKCVIDLHEFQLGHSGVFAKTKSGKTYFAKIIVYHITREEGRAALVFDMHQEYGFHPRGLKQVFDDELLVFTIDPKAKCDERIVIPYSSIAPEDFILARTDLNEAMRDAIYMAAEVYGDSGWFAALARDSSDPEERKQIVDQLVLDLGGMRDKEGMVKEGITRRGTIYALRRRIKAMTRLPFLSEAAEIDSIENMINHLLRGKSIVVDFGVFSRNSSIYVLVANLLTKKLFDQYYGMSEEERGSAPLLSIFVEEAHRFLGPEAARMNTVFPNIAREGRKYKLGLVVIDQKPSMIHEEVISQLHTQVFLRLTSDVDLDKIRRASEEDISQFIPEIKRLNQREALIVGDAVAFPSSIEVMWFDPSKLREEFMQEKKKMPKPEYEV